MPLDQNGVRPTPVTTGQAILTGWLLCGVLDITAACVQAWNQAGRTPAQVLRGVASALWGRAAMDGGAGMAAVGLAMHFAVALTATLVFYALSRRLVVLRTAPLWIVGPLYGVIVFCAMNTARCRRCRGYAASICTRRRAGQARWAGRNWASTCFRRHADRLGRAARGIVLDGCR